MSDKAQSAVGAETLTTGQSLDLRDLHAANIARQAEWCPDQVPDLSFRGNELGGECGEAQNVIKKLERERQGWRGSRATKDDLADELADVVICADLCAVTADIDLGAAVRRKFNATSEKQGLSVFLPLPALASPRADSDERTAGGELIAWMKREIRENREEASQSADNGNFYRANHFSAKATALEEALDLLSQPTTAQPARPLPDGLRALSEAAALLIADLDRSLVFGRDHAVIAATNASVKRLRTLLASHLGGPSAGSGAEDASRDFQMMLARIANRYTKGLDISATVAAARDLLKRKGTLSPFRDVPAPDSTRTGQVGVPDIVRSAVANAAAADGFANGPAAKHYAALLALEWVETLLAARPAAPEAQGD